MVTGRETAQVYRRRKDSTQRFSFTQDMIPTLSEKNNVPEFLKKYRIKAWEEFTNKPMPSTNEEAWRRTDLSKLDVESFRLPNIVSENALKESIASKYIYSVDKHEYAGQIIQTVSGLSRTFLDEDLRADGVVFCDLKTAERKHPNILEGIIGSVVKPEVGKFAALSGAMSSSGLLVFVPPNVSVKKPLYYLYQGNGTGIASISHVLVWLDKGSSLTLINESLSDSNDNGQNLHSGLVEIVVGDGANLKLSELQNWNQNTWNFTHEKVRVEGDGNLDWVIGNIGSRLTKSFVELDLVDDDASGKLSGFYFTNRKQHFDLDTQQNHLAPYTSSDLLFKGALTESSRSVWQGMIYVKPGAQKTDGYQMNRNLILDDRARVDSIPGLEILADDVRCSHGATVSKLDEEQLFYLQSRGISSTDAEKIIVEGFFDPVLQRIPTKDIYNRYKKAIIDKIE